MYECDGTLYSALFRLSELSHRSVVLIGTGHSASGAGATPRVSCGGVEWLMIPFPHYSKPELSQIVAHTGLGTCIGFDALVCVLR